MDKNRLIGCDNALPWHLPADLKHFRAVTMGKPIIMGRKTYESIGRPLPGRLNLILSRDPLFTHAGCEVLHSLDEILAFSLQYEESVVIGGASVYEKLLPEVQRMYVTWIEGEFRGDTYFPQFDAEQWLEMDRQVFQADAKNAYPYCFSLLERRRSS